MSATVTLKAETAQAFADLIAEITGAEPPAQPWLAPALLFASAEGQRRLALPRPGPEEMLIHDYQSVAYTGPFPLDTAFHAAAETRGQDHHITLSTASGPAAALTTALRVVRRADVAAANPAPFPPRLTETLTWSPLRTVAQSQTDRYLALSADPNLIHRDAALAASLGLGAPIVPGILLASLVQPAAEAALKAALVKLTARFMAPLAMGTPFRLAIQRRSPTRLRAYLAGEARALALVDVDVTP
ncbi:MAG: MaoC family dehydratase [Rhodobacter sp.]|nr:MaoC family dehydratase [Rhodobacter sp.]